MVYRRTTFLKDYGLELGPDLGRGLVPDLGLGPVLGLDLGLRPDLDFGPDLGLGLGLGAGLDLGLGFGLDLGLGFGLDLGLGFGLGLHGLVEGPEGKPDCGLQKISVFADFGHCWPRQGSILGQMKGGAVSRNQFVFILCHFRF